MMASPMICYCFRYTEKDIIRDLKKNQGISTILARITGAKRRNECHCETSHPERR